MKIKRVLLGIGIGLAVLVIVTAAGLYIWSVTGSYAAGQAARNALESDDLVEVTVDRRIRFEPRDGYDTGVVFYPGGLVEPAAYAPVLRRMAQDGVLVVIAPMPLNLALFNTGAADAVFGEYPEVSRWVLGGHSLGGTAAGIFASENSQLIDALFFWDSYPTDGSNLSTLELPVLSLYASAGGTAIIEGFDSLKSLLPPGTRFEAIEGASHAQFGDYGAQRGDVEPQISMEAQHDIIYILMSDFLSGL